MLSYWGVYPRMVEPRSQVFSRGGWREWREMLMSLPRSYKEMHLGRSFLNSSSRRIINGWIPIYLTGTH